MGWTYAFPNPCEPESFHESYSSGVLPDIISTLQLHWTREVNERLSIGEVGVDLELFVHAHGHDVDLIMEASHNNNYSLGIIWSCICDFGLCNRGSNQDCLLWSPFSDKLKFLPSAYQYTCPNSNMVYLRVLPLVSREYYRTALLLMISSSNIASR